MVRAWFPISEEWVRATGSLTTHERLFSLWTISEANREFSQGRSEFYCSDLEVGVTLGMSEDKVRRARRKFQAEGWLEVVPGFRANGRNLATTYKAVRWATPPKEGFFAPMHRHAFGSVLSRLRQGGFTHADILTYVILVYLRRRYDPDGTGEFFVTKQELREVTGIFQAPQSVERLNAGFEFSSGEALFDFTDQHHRLRFHGWSSFADPAEHEGSARNAERWREEIAEGVSGMKSKVKRKRKRGKPKGKRRVA
jgi:hypothetical protein